MSIVCVYVYILFVFVYACLYWALCVCVCVYIYIYIYIHIVCVHMYKWVLTICVYIYIYGLICFGWVLCHINYCRLLNAKSFINMYIKYILCKDILWTFLNNTEFICLHTVKWFQVLLCNSNSLMSVIYLQMFKWIYI